MTGKDFATSRRRWGLTQSEMACWMGYAGAPRFLEDGAVPDPAAAPLEIERISIDIAVERVGLLLVSWTPR